VYSSDEPGQGVKLGVQFRWSRGKVWNWVYNSDGAGERCEIGWPYFDRTHAAPDLHNCLVCILSKGLVWPTELNGFRIY